MSTRSEVQLVPMPSSPLGGRYPHINERKQRSGHPSGRRSTNTIGCSTNTINGKGPDWHFSFSHSLARRH